MTDASIIPFVDIETTGLDPQNDLILEVGIDLRDDQTLEQIDYMSWVIGHQSMQLQYAEEYAPEVVREMHKANGLWSDSYQYGVSSIAAEGELQNFLEKNSATGLPMAGSSLALDRAFLNHHMPDFHKLFHYRSIDNSSTKELCRRYAPNLFSALPDTQTDHRVKNCLTDTIEEFKFYKDNFLYSDLEPKF